MERLPDKRPYSDGTGGILPVDPDKAYQSHPCGNPGPMTSQLGDEIINTSFDFVSLKAYLISLEK